MLMMAVVMVMNSGFVRVMENLESHEILEFLFLGLESHGNLLSICHLMESHGKGSS